MVGAFSEDELVSVSGRVRRVKVGFRIYLPWIPHLMSYMWAWIRIGTVWQVLLERSVSRATLRVVLRSQRETQPGIPTVILRLLWIK